MKKSMIALLVSSVTLASVAQADTTTLYGEVKGTLGYKGGAKTSGIAGSAKFGIKGSTEFADGMDAKFDAKFKTSGTSVAVDKMYVSIDTGAATVSFGKQGLPDTGSHYSDAFNSHTPEATSALKYKDMNSHDGASVVVKTEMSGASVSAGVVMNADNTSSDSDITKHIDSLHLAASYEMDGISAGLGFKTDMQKTKRMIVSGGVGYSMDVIEGGVYADHSLKNDSDGTDGKGRTKVRLGVKSNLPDSNTSVYAGFALGMKGIELVKDSMAYSVGVNSEINDRSNMWLEAGHDGEDVNLTAGYKVKF